MFGLGPMEMVIVGVIAVLLFGSRLPEVARGLGKSMSEFRKGMSGLQDELHSATSGSSSSRASSPSRFNEIDDRDEATAPKFEPPASEPQVEKSDSA